MTRHAFKQALLTLCTASAICAAHPALAASSRTFVSTAGSDANGCGPTTPCRTFAAALALTSNGGEVVVLSSGGYGPATITQSVSITGEGLHPAISAAAGDGLTINAPGAAVEIDGLTLIGEGTATNGVHITGAASVILSNLTIGGFQNGVNALLPSTGAPAPAIHLSNCLIKGNSVAGVALAGSSTGSTNIVSAFIRNSRLLNNAAGVLVHDQAHAVVDSTDVLYGAYAIQVQTLNTASAASADVVYSNIGSSTSAIVYAIAAAGSTASVYVGSNTLIDANLAPAAFLADTACTTAVGGNGNCPISSDGNNFVLNQGAPSATITVQPSGAVGTALGNVF